ncbi:hypothetical protein DRP04_12850 [Archaeoglobales archaeon]|nr:MAG: hypothetical protein DRP04_12850 [Archaeoglobales archaeon]
MNREEYGKFFDYKNAIVLAPFIEGRGNKVHDFTRNRLDFTLYGGYRWNKLNPGLWFDGWTGYGATDYKDILEQKSFSVIFRTIWEGYTTTAKECASSAILGDIGTVTTDTDTGKKVISVTTLDGAGYCIVARFPGWKIREPVLTHRIEIWDETTSELILQADYDTDEYPDTLTYRSWQKQPRRVFFAEPDHTYLFKVYYYANVDMYFEWVNIDMIHRTPIGRWVSIWRYYAVRTGNFICYHPDGTYDICSGAGLLPFEDKILIMVYDYDNLEIRIYKDGKLSKTNSLSQRDLRTGNIPLKIGGVCDICKNYFYNGAFSFVGYYGKAFSDREAKLVTKQVKRGIRPSYITHRGVYRSVRNDGVELDGNMTNIAEVMC